MSLVGQLLCGDAETDQAFWHLNTSMISAEAYESSWGSITVAATAKACIGPELQDNTIPFNSRMRSPHVVFLKGLLRSHRAACPIISSILIQD